METVMSEGDRLNSIKKYRIMNGFSQKKLAKWIGVSQSVICLYESGERIPSNDVISQMTDLFGVTRSELFNIEIEMEKLNSVVYEDMTPGEIEEVIRYAEYIKWKRN